MLYVTLHHIAKWEYIKLFKGRPQHKLKEVL